MKEISPGISLEGMMLKLKLQSFGHLMWRVDSLEKTDAGRDWGQEEKGTTEDEKAGWHHWLNGRESGWTLGVGDGQGGLACCDSWGRKEWDTTEWLNWTELKSLLFNSKWIMDFRVKVFLVAYLCLHVCVHTKSLQSCLILFDLMDCCLPGSVHRQEYWSGLSCPPLGDLPNPGIEPMSLMSPALAGGFFSTSTTWEALILCLCMINCASVFWYDEASWGF